MLAGNISFLDSVFVKMGNSGLQFCSPAAWERKGQIGKDCLGILEILEHTFFWALPEKSL